MLKNLLIIVTFLISTSIVDANETNPAIACYKDAPWSLAPELAVWLCSGADFGPTPQLLQKRTVAYEPGTQGSALLRSDFGRAPQV
jgi:hypothetical protein